MGIHTMADRISVLAAEIPVFEGRARVLAQDDASLEHLLQEVDETVLPTALTFDTGVATLTMMVGGRRVHEISQASGTLNLPEVLNGTALSMEDTRLQSEAAKLLRAFLPGGGRLLVMTNRTDAGLIDRPESLSIGCLRAALGIGEEDLSPGERLMRRAGDAVKAHILTRDGNIQSSSGSSIMAASLKIAMTTQLRTFLDQRQKRCASHEDPSLTLLAEVVEEGCGIAVVIFAEETLIAAVPTTHFADMSAAFYAVN